MNSGNFFAVRQAIFDVQPNGVLDVRDRLLVGLPLAVTALEHRASDEIAVLVALNDNRKRQVLHARSMFLLIDEGKQLLGLASLLALHRRCTIRTGAIEYANGQGPFG